MGITTPLITNIPVAAGSLPPAAETPAPRRSSPQAEPAPARTVSLNQQSRIARAHTSAQGTEISHLINITDAPPTPQAVDINQAAKRLRILHMQKLEAEREMNGHEAPSAITKEICKQTFVLEGMVTALERENNPSAAITYSDITASVEENSRAIDGADGNIGYKRLFSDHALVNGDTLEDKLGLATASFKAYEEVLTSLDKDDPERAYIQLSYGVFKGSVQNLVREQSEALAGMRAGTPEHAQAQKNLDKAKAVENLVLNEEIRQGLRNKQTPGNLMRALVGAVPAAMIGSLLHFGYIKNIYDDRVTGQNGYDRRSWKENFAERALVSGGATGVMYSVLPEITTPLGAYVAELVGGLPVQAVDPKVIYPDAPDVISENGVPRKLEADEYAQAQQAVKERRAAFKQAQAAFKIGSVAGDMIGCASFGLAQVARVLLNGVLGVDAKSLDTRAVTSSVGGGLTAGGMILTQLSQNVDGVPTHTVGRPRGEKQISDGLSRLNPLVSDNRRNFLAKTVGTMEGVAMATGLDTAIANSSLSTLQGKPAQAAVTGAEAFAMLHPFFSNVGAESEVKEAQAQQVVPSSSAFVGTKTVLHGLMQPDSAHIPHTFQEPDSWTRKAENVYQVTRHAAQLVPQLVVDGVNFGVTVAEKGALALPRTIVSTLQRLGRHSSYTEPLLG